MKQNMIMMLFLSCFFTLVQSGDDARQAEHEKRTHETDSDFFKNLGEEGEMKYRAGMTRYAVNPDPEPWSNRAKSLESELKEKRALEAGLKSKRELSAKQELAAKKIQKAWKKSKKPKLIAEEQDRLNQELMNEALNRFSDTSKIIALLNAGADPKIKRSNDLTPLHMAKTEDQTRALLAAGADPNAKTKDGDTPMHFVRTQGQVRVLSELGLNPNVKNNDGWTPLHFCMEPDVIKALHAIGADPNVQNKAGDTPLHRTINDDILTRTLLTIGADPNIKNNSGETPLHMAKTEDQTRALLAAGADPNAKTKDGNTPLEKEFTRGRVTSLQVMKHLIKGGATVPEYLKTKPIIKQAAREAMEERIQALKTRDALRSKSFDFDAANLVNEYVGK